jgi:GNAT superfamily N-acetyltransferase
MSQILRAETKKDLLRCFPVVVQLRPHLAEADFLQRVERQRQQSFQIAFLEDTGEVRSVTGYRFLENLAWGKFLYVDDLVTAEADRSRGYGQQMFAWLLQEAKAADCDQLHLDSGVQRFGAHRFYLGQGMDITCHHFAIKLK